MLDNTNTSQEDDQVKSKTITSKVNPNNAMNVDMQAVNEDYSTKQREESPNYEPLHLSDTELYMTNNNRQQRGRLSPGVKGGGFSNLRPL